MFNTPILFLIFNRPDTTEKVFERIREIKPKRLFIAADGPRKGNETDKLNCITAREIATNVDWDCDVKTLLREENLGCGLAVSQAITWFFGQVEMGIILEDDVLPSRSFFSFCEELLMLYKDDSEVMHISGGSYLPNSFFGKESYYFSNYPFCWGWATWKRAWENFRYEVNASEQDFRIYFSDKVEVEYWRSIKTQIVEGKLDTWAFRWNFSVWMKKGKVICSTKNLVKNIGFGPNGTHTFTSNYYYDKIELTETEKLVQPRSRNVNLKADKLVFKRYNLLEVNYWDRVKSKIRKWATSISQFG